MKGLCGADCSICELFKNQTCEGCEKSRGCLAGKKCWIYRYIELGGEESFLEMKKTLLNEIHSLSIDGMSSLDDLYPLHGSLVNLEYPLPNGEKVSFLKDDEVYLGNQVSMEGDVPICFGIVCNMDFILISTYEENGKNPELILYHKR
ncbi:MAG: DUF3795 domain-containing protein [Bacilli bacterium]|nr:DUF3795 domain-containing protein [Bacilli bacterium]